MKESVLKDYLYNGLSFSTFKFDEASFYALKYVESKLFFVKNRYKRKLIEILEEEFPSAKITNNIINYYAFQTKVAITNSSLLFSNNKQNMNLYKRIKNNNCEIMNGFNNDDLPMEIFSKRITLIVKSKNKIKKYLGLTKLFQETNVIVLDELKVEKEVLILDQIKLKLLQDDNEIYFVEAGFYSNLIIDILYNQNKIGINL